MEIIYGDQGTDEWRQHRIASIGGTAINLIAPQKKGYKDTLYKMVGELLTGVKAESFKFQHADRGTETEPEARDHYSFVTGNEVEQVSLIKGDPHMHVSPDGLVSRTGYLEIKTRIPSVFVQAKDENKLPLSVIRQVQWGMSISEREWADVVQYCPEMARSGVNPMIITRVERDEKLIVDLHRVANQFIEEMHEMAERIKER